MNTATVAFFNASYAHTVVQIAAITYTMDTDTTHGYPGAMTVL